MKHIGMFLVLFMALAVAATAQVLETVVTKSSTGETIVRLKRNAKEVFAKTSEPIQLEVDPSLRGILGPNSGVGDCIVE